MKSMYEMLEIQTTRQLKKGKYTHTTHTHTHTHTHTQTQTHGHACINLQYIQIQDNRGHMLTGAHVF